MLGDVPEQWEPEAMEERNSLRPPGGQGIPGQSGKLAAVPPADEMYTGCPSFRNPAARVRRKTGKALDWLAEHYCNMDRAWLFIPFYAFTARNMFNAYTNTEARSWSRVAACL